MMRKKQLIIDYQQKFGDEQGKRVLQDLRKFCTAFDNPITCNDPTALAIEVGKANVMKHIFRRLRLDPNDAEALPTKAINITSDTPKTN